MSAKRRVPCRVLLLACVSITAGCASLTPQQVAERQFQRDLHEATFLAYRQRCFAMGGKIYVDAYRAATADRVPHRAERYFCG